MKRLTPAPFRIVQEKPKGHVQFHHRYWVIWEWNDAKGKYEYYLFTLNRDRAFSLLEEVLRRRRIRALEDSLEVPC